MKYSVPMALALAALLTSSAHAASPGVDAAVKTFAALGTDAAKLKTFCAMDMAMSAGDQEKDAGKIDAINKEVDGFMQSLGQEFQTAWKAGDQLSPESADGKEYYAALEALSAKCPK